MRPGPAEILENVLLQSGETRPAQEPGRHDLIGIYVVSGDEHRGAADASNR
jgi:hypothetical protein